jgi:hypothetical protein
MPTDLILPDVSCLSPAQRLRWAQEVMQQTRPGSPGCLWLGAEVLRQAAQSELTLLRQSHPSLFPQPSLFQDNQPQPQPQPQPPRA